MKIIGIREQEGEFNGKPYHNYKLYCINPDMKSVVCGYGIEEHKISAKVLFELNLTPELLIDTDVTFMYNKFGQICSIVPND